MNFIPATFTTTRASLLALMLLFCAQGEGHESGLTTGHPDGEPSANAEHTDDPSLPGKYTRVLANYKIPDTNLIAANGSPTSLLAELDVNKPVMLNFIFTSCNTICPVLSASLAQMRDKMGHEADALRMVSISIDPEHDTPARLQAYAHKYHAGPEWRFLTGDAANALLLQQAFDVYRGGKMNHVPVTFLRAAHASSWVRLEGLANADDLLREYRSLTSP